MPITLPEDLLDIVGKLNYCDSLLNSTTQHPHHTTPTHRVKRRTLGLCAGRGIGSRGGAEAWRKTFVIPAQAGI